MRHETAYYSEGDSHIKIEFCRICGKEGLQLALEPECPGEIPKINSPSLDKKSELK